MGDVLEHQPGLPARQGCQPYLDPADVAAILPGGSETAGRVTALDRAARIALELIAAAGPQVAGDRQEPPRNPLWVGAGIPEVLEGRVVDLADGYCPGLTGRQHAGADLPLDGA